MAAFTVELSRAADSYLKKLPKDQQKRVTDKLSEVCNAPLEKSKKLVNRGGQRCSRVGSIRILFDIDERLRKLLVTAILPRGEVYKHSKR